MDGISKTQRKYTRRRVRKNKRSSFWIFETKVETLLFVNCYSFLYRIILKDWWWSYALRARVPGKTLRICYLVRLFDKQTRFFFFLKIKLLKISTTFIFRKSKFFFLLRICASMVFNSIEESSERSNRILFRWSTKVTEKIATSNQSWKSAVYHNFCKSWLFFRLWPKPWCQWVCLRKKFNLPIKR